MLKKIQAIYFKIQCTYFKISALYFCPFQTSETQQLTKETQILRKQLFFRHLRNSTVFLKFFAIPWFQTSCAQP